MGTVVVSTPSQLKDAGHTAWELRRCGYTAPELKDAGYNLTHIRTAHYPAQELMDAGFSIRQLRLAFASAQELKDSGCKLHSSVAREHWLPVLGWRGAGPFRSTPFE